MSGSKIEDSFYPELLTLAQLIRAKNPHPQGGKP